MKKRSSLVVLFDRECPVTDAEADRQLGVLMSILGDESDTPLDDCSASLPMHSLLMSAVSSGEIVLH